MICSRHHQVMRCNLPKIWSNFLILFWIEQKINSEIRHQKMYKLNTYVLSFVRHTVRCIIFYRKQNGFCNTFDPHSEFELQSMVWIEEKHPHRIKKTRTSDQLTVTSWHSRARNDFLSTLRHCYMVVYFKILKRSRFFLWACVNQKFG